MRVLKNTLSFLLIGAAMQFVASQAHGGALDDARRFADAHQYGKAMEQLDRFLEESPKDPRGRFLKGVILAEQNRRAEAIALFRELSDEYRDLPEPYNNLAVLYAEQGEYELARESLLKAIKTHPSYSTAHENLGDIYARLASEAYAKALQINQGNATVQTKLDMIRELFVTPVAKGGEPVVAAKKGTVVAQAKPVREEVAPKVEPPTQEPVKVEKPQTTFAPLPVMEPIRIEKPTPVKAEKPAVEPTKPANPEPVAPAVTIDTEHARLSQEASRLVLDWSKAWAAKDYQSYMAFYGKEFKPPRGMSRDAWGKERKERLQRPKFIQVTVSNIRVTSVDADEMKVRFFQEYKADHYNSRTTKVLHLKREGGRWKITQELSDA